MRNLFANIQEMGRKIKSVVVMFSTGIDSCVMLDLCCKHIEHVEAAYWYYAATEFDPVTKRATKVLSYKQNFLDKVANKYGIKIHLYPEYGISRIIQTGAFVGETVKAPKITEGDLEFMIRKDTGIPYIALGWLYSDCLSRAGIMKMPHIKYGIDSKYHKLFPLAGWSKKHVKEYVSRNKVFLPPEYKYGFRDINVFKGEALLWLYDKYPQDYLKLKEMYPFIEAELLRAKANV